jgi:hypothetical protein
MADSEAAEAAWPDRPSELWRRWERFVPIRGAGHGANCNAVLRMAFAFALAMAIIRGDLAYFAVPAVVAAATWVAIYSAQQREGMLAAGGRGLGSGCREPDEANPYMNAIHTRPPQGPGACDPLAPEVDRRVEEAAGWARFRDDVWDSNKRASRFLTNPSTTVPNDREAYTEFLYGDMRKGGGKQTRMPVIWR